VDIDSKISNSHNPLTETTSWWVNNSNNLRTSDFLAQSGQQILSSATEKLAVFNPVCRSIVFGILDTLSHTLDADHLFALL
jgi:hypothetical protein